MKHPYLFCVDDYSNYMHVLKLNSKTHASVWEIMQDIIVWYASYNWPVMFISSDHEAIMGSMRADLAAVKPRIGLELLPTDTHEKTAERSTRTVRERIRVIKIDCWYKSPEFLTPWIVEDITMCQNAVPSRRISHTAIFTVEGRTLNYLTHLRYPILTVGEFRVPGLPNEQRSQEERTATGIIVGRNLD